MILRQSTTLRLLVACAALVTVAPAAAGHVTWAAVATAAENRGRKSPYADLDPALRQVLEKFDTAQAGVTALSARFTERKHLGLLKNDVIQQGRFYHTKPDKFLWEYSTPEPKVLLMTGSSLVAYYPRQKQAEEIRTRLSRRLIKYFGIGQVFSDLQEYYKLSIDPANEIAGTHLIIMKPKQRRLEKRVTELRLWLDDRLNQIRQLEYREADGDRTLFVFEEIEVNPAISPARYTLELPNDVKVSDTFSGFFSQKGR